MIEQEVRNLQADSAEVVEFDFTSGAAELITPHQLVSLPLG